MLGVTIRFDSYHDAEEHLCRVTEVMNAAYEPNYLEDIFDRCLRPDLLYSGGSEFTCWFGWLVPWKRLSIGDSREGDFTFATLMIWTVGCNADCHCQFAICLAFSSQQSFYSISHSLVTLFLTFLQVFRDTDVLYEELAANLETPVEFYVYNADSDEVPSDSFDHRNSSRNFSLMSFNPILCISFTEINFVQFGAATGPYSCSYALGSVGR